MSFKKTLCILAAVLLLSLSACNKDTTAPAGFVTASGEAARYSFYVPKEWTVDLSTGATSAYFSTEDPSSVSVMTWELPASDTTLDDWWSMNQEDIQMIYFLGFQDLEELHFRSLLKKVTGDSEATV